MSLCLITSPKTSRNLDITPPLRPQHAPHAWNKPVYEISNQQAPLQFSLAKLEINSFITFILTPMQSFAADLVLPKARSHCAALFTNPNSPQIILNKKEILLKGSHDCFIVSVMGRVLVG